MKRIDDEKTPLQAKLDWLSGYLTHPEINTVLIHDGNTLENTEITGIDRAIKHLRKNAYYLDSLWLHRGIIHALVM